jgi:hypothetical protein
VSAARTRRVYEHAALIAARRNRTLVLFWARQCRKSTTLGAIAFDELSRAPGRSVVAASASLLLGSELVSKTFSAAEQAALVSREAAAVKAAIDDGAGEAGEAVRVKIANTHTGKVYERIGADDFAELYSTSRLEMRLYHSQTRYSRLQVIAPNPATARGWSGMVLRDEAGFTRPGLETELRIAVKPIIDTDPTFRLIYASNLPRDDRHPFFEMTMPETGIQFQPEAKGHFYRGQDGTLIHRVALAYAYAAGHTLYDTQTGAPLSYDQFCADPANRLGLNDSYRLIHEFGGTAAVDLTALIVAQQRGAGQCAFFFVDTHAEFLRAVAALRGLLGAGRVGIGFDVATTTGDTSNPSAITVTEDADGQRIQRLVCVWKERSPDVVRERIGAILAAIRQRHRGGPAVRLAVDATSEQLFARDLANALGRHGCPVDLVDARKLVEPAPPGYPRTPNHKIFLGDLYSSALNENRYTIPSSDYLKADHRMVVKAGGMYQCDPEPDGRHGDTFDSGKLAEWSLTQRAGYISDPNVIRTSRSAPVPSRRLPFSSLRG